MIGFRSILSNPWGNPHQDQKLCNPYTQAGYLNFSLPAAEVSDLPITSEHHLNLNHQSEPIPVPNWVSFDESECEAKDHMTQILRSEYEDWMYNSTIIVIGDSVERNNLEYVCDGLGADHQIYLPGHPLRPKPWDITLDGRPDPLPVPDRFPASEHVPQWLRNVGEREAAFRSCIIPSINFKMVSLFHYGLFASKATEDRIIATMGHFFPPARLELRIQYLLYPLLKNLKIEIEEIDLVEFSSGAWDLQEWNRVIDPPWSVWELRHHHQLNPINFPTRFEPFDLDSLLGYGHRLNEILNSLMDDLFPSHRTGFSIRSFHPIGISTLVPAPKFTQLGRFQTWNVKNLVRLRSSNARSQTPINHAWDLGKLEINPWGTLLEGQVGVSYLDAVHPGRLPGGQLLFPSFSGFEMNVLLERMDFQ